MYRGIGTDAPSRLSGFGEAWPSNLTSLTCCKLCLRATRNRDRLWAGRGPVRTERHWCPGKAGSHIDRGTSNATTTNNSGLYTFSSVRPGRYRIEVAATAFKIVNVTGLTVNVQDHLEQNFRLQIGSVAESVTVEANALQVNTTDATVSTVVDRQFAENLPMNGRSFQTLIELTPGVVVTPSSAQDGGQFSINGQRPDANYWMVDGVGANIGSSSANLAPGNGVAGALGSFSVLGGTNSLVSVDAMQEFRIQTSTYAPEFGRTPGGQISIVTRSGTNQFHGTLFDYLRNDIFDANNWFNGINILNATPIPKAKERQNDFGGTFSGPILKDRTFFFFSYEGLRLRLPQTGLTQVPDLSARQNASPALQPYLNAFPFDPNQPDLGSGIAEFNAAFSDPASLDAYSLRVDHKLSSKISLFGRYNYSPSDLEQRGAGDALSTVGVSNITTQTATVGAAWVISPTTANDLRFNYSRTNASSNFVQDSFGGAVPLESPPFPSPYTTQNAQFYLAILSLESGGMNLGRGAHNLQRQVNAVNNLSIQRGHHSLKFGVDFRRLSPSIAPDQYLQQAYFTDVPSIEIGSPLEGLLESTRSTTLLFRNLGVFAQDTWRVLSSLTLTYGLRWDVDFAPSAISGPGFPALTGFNLDDLSTLALAPTGTAPYTTTYRNVAPRIGLAYQLSHSQEWQTVARGGFGMFYDLASSQAGNLLSYNEYPFGANSFLLGPPLGGTATFPFSSANAAPPPILPTAFAAFDPHLRLPYALEWNFAIEQTLGTAQTISASYVGSVGRRLMQTALVEAPNANLSSVALVTNAAVSDYNALQLQFQRRLSHGLQVLASYTWSHSTDDASAGSIGEGSNALVPGTNPNLNRGPSDFDIRDAFSAGVTYDIPGPRMNGFTNALLRGWLNGELYCGTLGSAREHLQRCPRCNSQRLNGRSARCFSRNPTLLVWAPISRRKSLQQHSRCSIGRVSGWFP